MQWYGSGKLADDPLLLSIVKNVNICKIGCVYKNILSDNDKILYNK